MRACVSNCQFCDAMERIQRGNAETAKIIRDLQATLDDLGDTALDTMQAILDSPALTRPRGRAAQWSPYDIGGRR